MRRGSVRNRFGMRPEETLGLAALGAATTTVVSLWAAAALAHLSTGAPAPVDNPFALGLALARGRFAWIPAATLWLAVEGVFGAVATGVVVWRVRRSPGRHDADGRAGSLVRHAGSLRRYTDHGAGAAALPAHGPGPAVGRDTVSGRLVRMRQEDVLVWIAGARMGKTTAGVVPAIVDAPGAVYATSNKRDVVDMTRGLREAVGKVWIFDPQGIAGTTPEWWWNPLDMATTVPGARTLAGLFVAATRPVGSSTDAYFDPEGEELLAMLLLAAAAAERPITDVYRWLNDTADEDSIRHLSEAGAELAALGVRGVLDFPDRQRAGVFGTAKKMVGFLADPSLARRATPPRSAMPRFVAEDFVASSATAYSLSKEGPGTAGPLTAALTVAVLQAAERRAADSPGGRLATPIVCALDEVANVCRWRELPDLYSHYGSRGILLLSFLQSWAQGVECWGREGMTKLWGAANIRVYGGGVSEADFLENVSRLCGEVDAPTWSDGYSYRNGRTRTWSWWRERIFDVASLAALPAGRAAAMLSAANPVLLRTTSCFDGPHADGVRASVERYGPKVAAP